MTVFINEPFDISMKCLSFMLIFEPKWPLNKTKFPIHEYDIYLHLFITYFCLLVMCSFLISSTYWWYQRIYVLFYFSLNLTIISLCYVYTEIISNYRSSYSNQEFYFNLYWPIHLLDSLWRHTAFQLEKFNTFFPFLKALIYFVCHSVYFKM